MSLLLLFGNSGDSPVIVVVDYGVKPMLLSISKDKTTGRLEVTSAVFQDSNVTYNQAGLTYNDINTLYGGSDRLQGGKPAFKNIGIDTPRLASIPTDKPSNSVDRTYAVYQNSTVTYNESGLTYNDINTLYGGSDNVIDSGPRLVKVGS